MPSPWSKHSLLAALLFLLLLPLSGCATKETGKFTIKLFNASGDLVETVKATTVSVVDEENKISFTDSTGKIRKFTGSFEIYDAAD